MRNKIWFYISNRYENDGVLVDLDEVYEAFAVDFDNGYPVDVIDEVMEDFISCSDLTGIKIEYEGGLDGVSFRGITEEFGLSPKTA